MNSEYTSELSIDDRSRLTILASKGYKINDSILGKGSYGVVRPATSRIHGGREVAIKIISKRKSPTDFLQRFLPRELDVIRRLHHRNIVTFLQCIETPNRVYIVMELVSNGTLLHFIRRVRHVEEEGSCVWFHHLVDGIAYCHGRGVVHRDIKCENLLIDHNYVLKITDFGFARGELDLDVYGPVVNRNKILSRTYCGSYAYSAPEILRGQPYEMHMADVWSMGVVLYTMLCGRLPFNDSNHKVQLQEMERSIRYPTLSTVSSQAKTLVRKILQVEVRERAYLPQIKDDPWYIDNWNPSWRPSEKSPTSDTRTDKKKQLHKRRSVEQMSTVTYRKTSY